MPPSPASKTMPHCSIVQLCLHVLAFHHAMCEYEQLMHTKYIWYTVTMVSNVNNHMASVSLLTTSVT